MRHEAHPTEFLLHGEPKLATRIPDLTIGLARPDWETGADSLLHPATLERIMLHRDSGLISDPSCDETPNIIFPFAVYEAKGYKGDPRKARHQATEAGAAYLDLLDALSREPDKAGGLSLPHQTEQSNCAQVFALTSFGPHWHIMVGYKRKRGEDEHAGAPGLSENVYVSSITAARTLMNYSARMC